MNREQRRAMKRAERSHSKPPVIRKVWPTDIDTIQYAIDRASIPDRSKLNKILIRELACLNAFTNGTATMQELSELVSMNKVAQTLAGMGVGPEAIPDCMKAEAGLIEAAERFERTGKMGLSGSSIQALRDVIEWHDTQRDSIPQGQYLEAIRLTGARIKSGHATIDLEKTLGAPAH